MQPQDLKDIRKAVGWTQDRMAKALGVSRLTAGEMERGNESITERTERQARMISLIPRYRARREAELRHLEAFEARGMRLLSKVLVGDKVIDSDETDDTLKRLRQVIDDYETFLRAAGDDVPEAP